MKCLRRNTTEFEYLPQTGETSDLNEDGEHTGEFYPVMGEPVTYRGSIFSPSGHTNQQFYGKEIRYTHTLVMDNPNAEIDVHGVIRWKGDLYDITAVRPSLNALSAALWKQTDPEEEPDTPDDPDEPEEPQSEEPEGEEP